MKLFNCAIPIRLAFLTLLVGLTGCASLSPMALNSDSKTLDVSSKSVLLMTLDVFRSDGSRHHPNPKSISFEKRNATDKAEIKTFKIEDADTLESKAGREVYLLSLDLEPGQYKLTGINGDANAFPFHGVFFVPLLMDVSIQKNVVTYIGRVKAELRPRQGNEFRAGGVIPLIDQAVSGVSTGTFDIAVEDFSKEDIPFFRTTYPALTKTEIHTDFLPPFDRAKVQQWWENDYKSDAQLPAKKGSTKE